MGLIAATALKWLCSAEGLMLTRFASDSISSDSAKCSPPRRFIAGTDAMGTAEQKIVALQEDIESNRPLSTSLEFDGD